MKELLPKSLFSRMMGVLLLGLLVAQTLNGAIHVYQHHIRAEQASFIEAARRLAIIIRLISVLDPDIQQTVIEQFYDPVWHLQIAKKPIPLSKTGEVNDPRFKVFRTTLYALLGTHQPRRILISEREPQHFMVQVQLQNNTTLLLSSSMNYSNEEESSSEALYLAIILIAITGLSYIAVHWVTRPLENLANAAEELGKDIHRPPLDERGPNEVSRAAHAFNSMQASLIRHIQDRTQLLAAISHDLKTPITRLRLRTELLDDDGLRQRFQKDLDEMESMVMATLDFMRGVDQQESLQMVDITALLESLQADAQEIQAEVNILGARSQPYFGKPSALKRCLSNLLDNALKYGHSANLSVEDDAENCIIRIQDAGRGIPAGQLQKVFTPYYRLEPSRNRNSGGTGLGLSIARDIAIDHGGSLVLQNLESGGLEAILTLPRKPSSH